MYQRDYVLRLIERFGRMLIALRDRILRRDVESAPLQTEIHDIAREAGLDLDIARRLDPEMLLLWLAPTGDVDEAKFWLLGELLYLAGLEAYVNGEADRGRADFLRALAVFSRVRADWRPQPDLISAGERRLELSERLGQPEDP